MSKSQGISVRGGGEREEEENNKTVKINEKITTTSNERKQKATKEKQDKNIRLSGRQDERRGGEGLEGITK